MPSSEIKSIFEIYIGVGRHALIRINIYLCFFLPINLNLIYVTIIIIARLYICSCVVFSNHSCN